jgi:hypothetical protein
MKEIKDISGISYYSYNFGFPTDLYDFLPLNLRLCNEMISQLPRFVDWYGARANLGRLFICINSVFSPSVIVSQPTFTIFQQKKKLKAIIMHGHHTSNPSSKATEAQKNVPVKLVPIADFSNTVKSASASPTNATTTTTTSFQKPIPPSTLQHSRPPPPPLPVLPPPTNPQSFSSTTPPNKSITRVAKPQQQQQQNQHHTPYGHQTKVQQQQQQQQNPPLAAPNTTSSRQSEWWMCEPFQEVMEISAYDGKHYIKNYYHCAHSINDCEAQKAVHYLPNGNLESYLNVHNHPQRNIYLGPSILYIRFKFRVNCI